MQSAKIKKFEKWIDYITSIPFFKKRDITYTLPLIDRLNIEYGSLVLNPNLLTYTIKPRVLKVYKDDVEKGKSYSNLKVTSLFLYHDEMVLKSRRHYRLSNYVTVLTPTPLSLHYVNIDMKHYQYFDTDEGRIFCKMTHPHISSSNSPCYGSYRIQLKKTVESLNINFLSIFLRKWFTSFNGRDSYFRCSCLDKSIVKFDEDINKYFDTDVRKFIPVYFRTVIPENEVVITPLVKRLVRDSFNTSDLPDSFYKGIKRLMNHFKWSTEEAVYKFLTKPIDSPDNQLDKDLISSDDIKDLINLWKILRGKFNPSFMAIHLDILLTHRLSNFVNKINLFLKVNLEDTMSSNYNLTETEVTIVKKLSLEMTKLEESANTKFILIDNIDNIINAIINDTSIKISDRIKPISYYRQSLRKVNDIVLSKIKIQLNNAIERVNNAQINNS